jgi:hypothetical protein
MKHIGQAFVLGLCLTALPTVIAFGQGPVPDDVSDLAHKDLDSAQKTLKGRGYEIVYSSYTSRTQYWWNDKTQTCVSMKIKDKTAESFKTINKDECQKRLANARKAWQGYADGGLDIHSTPLDAQRETLKNKGFEVIYSVRDAAPGRSAEYFKNAATNQCSMVAFNTSDGNNVEVMDKTGDKTMDWCTNPAPKH